jgi:hypothetical protein
MANEQNEQAQDIQNEQQTEQTQAEGVEQANELSVEDLQAQITKLEESLKLEKARTANAVYEAQRVLNVSSVNLKNTKIPFLRNLLKSCWIQSTILNVRFKPLVMNKHLYLKA